MEAVGQGVVAILGAGDFDIAAEGRGHGGDRSVVLVEGDVEADGEDAGSESGGAAHLMLGEGYALEGEHLLRVDGLVEGDEIGSEIGDLVEIFEPDDGEGRGGKAVSAGILGGAGFAFGSAGAGALLSVGAVGCDLLVGSWHNGDPFASQIASEMGFSSGGSGKLWVPKELVLGLAVIHIVTFRINGHNSVNIIWNA